MTVDVTADSANPLSVGPLPVGKSGWLGTMLGGSLRAALYEAPLLFLSQLAFDVMAFHVMVSAMDFDDVAVDEPGTLLAGLIMLLSARIGFAVWIARRNRAAIGKPVRPEAAAQYFQLTLAVLCFGVILAGAALSAAEVLVEFPDSTRLVAATTGAIDGGVEFLTQQFSPFFDTITWLMRVILDFIEDLLIGMPWIIVIAVSSVAAFFLGGARMAAFTSLSLVYIGIFGFWEPAMVTMSLVVASLFICIIVGLPLGILCSKSDRIRRWGEPVLDVMQTLPTFVYLIPAVALFSIGKPPGVIATVIFALPSMVRLTDLGIRQVPASVKEASLAFGASPLQLLLKTELPLALPSIKVGINQTIMMSLSMAVVAAMIGAGGLGLDVIRALSHLQTGKGILAGMALVLCAMLLDRFLRGRNVRPR